MKSQNQHGKKASKMSQTTHKSSKPRTNLEEIRDIQVIIHTKDKSPTHILNKMSRDSLAALPSMDGYELLSLFPFQTLTILLMRGITGLDDDILNKMINHQLNALRSVLK